MGVVIAVANQKGGVGKTTVVANLGMVLRQQKYRVLLIDLDPQACLSLSFGIEAATNGIGAALTGRTPIEGCISQTGTEGTDLIPADEVLSLTEGALSQLPDPQQRLARTLEALVPNYDFVLLDCPPTVGLLTSNALVAADHLIVPICSEYLALRGLRRILGLFKAVRERWKPGLNLLGILVAIYDRRSKMSEQILQILRERFGSQLFRTVIRQSAWAKRAPAHEQPIITLAPHSGIADDYRRLGVEVIRRVEEAAGSGKDN